MYVLLQILNQPAKGVPDTWYFVDGAFTWSDDPHKATRMTKKEATFWLNAANAFYDTDSYYHRLVDAREHYLTTRLADLYQRVGKAKVEGDRVAFYDLKRQYIAVKGKLKRLKEKQQ